MNSLTPPMSSFLLSPSDLIRGSMADTRTVATMDARIKSGHDKGVKNTKLFIAFAPHPDLLPSGEKEEGWDRVLTTISLAPLLRGEGRGEGQSQPMSRCSPAR